jgi:hypothetical protein
MVVLTYPKRVSIAFSDTMIRLYNLAKSAKDNDVVFDLNKSESLTPFGVVMLTSTIDECFRKKKKCSYIEPIKPSIKAFLVDIGFNSLFHLNTGDIVPDRMQTGTFQLRRVKGLDALIPETLTDIIGYHVNISPGLNYSLRLSLNELMTNVIDHSGVQNYYVCAYTYPDKGQLRLCMADRGIGILRSLNRSGKYSLKSPHEAILLATTEGVSSRPSRAGLGLSHLKNFAKVNNGQMCIISGRGKVFWKYDQGKILKQRMIKPFTGTVVKFVINTDKEGLYFLAEEENFLF